MALRRPAVRQWGSADHRDVGRASGRVSDGAANRRVAWISKVGLGRDGAAEPSQATVLPRTNRLRPDGGRRNDYEDPAKAALDRETRMNETLFRNDPEGVFQCIP